MQMIASLPGRTALRDVAGWAARVERLGFDVLHVPETIHDPFVVAALALGATDRLVVRTSMVVAFPRSPMVTAYGAWDLAGLSGGRFELGIASQVRGNIVGRFSTEWSDPVGRLGDYIDSLRAIFRSFETGEALNHEGPHYRFTRLQQYFNPGPLGLPAPHIWTGGVNRRMCVMAGAKADGFVCHPTSSHPRILAANILPALAEGASAAGRTDTGPSVITNPQPLLADSATELAIRREDRRSSWPSSTARRPTSGSWRCSGCPPMIPDSWICLSPKVSTATCPQYWPSGIPGCAPEWCCRFPPTAPRTRHWARWSRNARSSAA